ncbi:MAG: hypothetical protein U1E18_28350 [Brevundimonas sp.]|uniref:hypothetical protein n=1 Tax=Brevundimonas sp. TaxID=1871086 RepID=UPI002AB92DFF|nr:hypothetical protein [Brevundimonas sp.]MDZ4113484.1 hypothetical protein [Brevundimonas sp.]
MFMALLLFPLFVVAQGGAVFASAWLVTRLLKVSHWGWKSALMALSYTAWIVMTIAGYFLLSGGGGVMEGFAVVLMLCLTALASAFVYLVLWIALPAGHRVLARDRA